MGSVDTLVVLTYSWIIEIIGEKVYHKFDSLIIIKIIFTYKIDPASVAFKRNSGHTIYKLFSMAYCLNLSISLLKIGILTQAMIRAFLYIDSQLNVTLYLPINYY